VYSTAEHGVRIAKFLVLTHTSVEVLDMTTQSSGRILRSSEQTEHSN